MGLALGMSAAYSARVGYGLTDVVDSVKRFIDGSPARVVMRPDDRFKKVTIWGCYAAPGEARVWYVEKGDAERGLANIVGHKGDGTFKGKEKVYDDVDADGDGYITQVEVRADRDKK